MGLEPSAVHIGTEAGEKESEDQVHDLDQVEDSFEAGALQMVPTHVHDQF